MVVDLLQPVTQAEFSALIGVDQSVTSRLITRGVLRRGASAGQWLCAYIEHLQTVADARAEAGDLDLATERAALARAQRERLDIQNTATREGLAPTDLLNELLTKAGNAVALQLETIPRSVSQNLPQVSPAAIAMIAGEVGRAISVVRAMSLADVTADNQEDDTGTPEIFPGNETEAQNHHQEDRK